MQNSLKQLIKDSNLIFLDFDGVIKDSLAVKAFAFESLFSEFGSKVVDLIKTHHAENSGISRFEKIPLYLSWAGKSTSKENIDKYCKNFASLVKQSVIDSSWVPGVLEFLESNYKDKKLIIVTATPVDEIHEILKKTEILHFFLEIYGSPTSKADALSSSLNKFSNDANKAIMIGDSYCDYEAAKKNNIFFALRCTDFNYALQSKCMCYMFNDFNDE